MPDVVHADLSTEIAQRLQEWQEAGLLTAEQAERIARAEAAHHVVEMPAPPERPAEGPSVVEALAYVGAALVAAACALLVGRLWGDLTTAAHVGLLAGLAAAGLAAGFLVRLAGDGTTRRLRALLWTGAAVAAGGAAGILADAGGWDGRDVVLAGGATALVLAAPLWWRCPSILLHGATFAASVVTVAAAADHVSALHDQASALGVWLLAVGWVALGRFWRAIPEQAATVIGSLAAVLAAQGLAQVGWGIAVALATAAAVVALAVYRRSLTLLVVGAFGVFTSVPDAMARLVPGSVGVALGLLLAGMTLLGSAVLTVRRRSR